MSLDEFLNSPQMIPILLNHIVPYPLLVSPKPQSASIEGLTPACCGSSEQAIPLLLLYMYMLSYFFKQAGSCGMPTTAGV